MNIEEYFSRVFPVIGRALEGKRIAFFGAKHCAPIMEAFARCGLYSQIVFDSGRIEEGDNLHLYYGRSYVGNETVQSLADFFRQHNRLAVRWDIRHMPALEPVNLREARSALSGVSLIVGGGCLSDCLLIEHLSDEFRIPAVLFTVLEKSAVNSVVFACIPGLERPVRMFVERVIEKAGCPAALDRIPLSRRLDWLEACDLAMNLAKAIILRGTEHQRADIEHLIFEQGRNVILRGTEGWPWWVFYLSPRRKADALQKLFSVPRYHTSYPLHLLEGERVMVIGCGTASLFAGESVHYFRDLLMVDCKPFSVYNPVRQLAGTDHVNTVVKPFVVQEILAERVSPGMRWEKKEGLFTTVSDGRFSFSAAELALAGDDQSITHFISLLDSYRPTLAIVAMGDAEGNSAACEILRERGIRHIIPSAFPGATHFEKIVVDGREGPCYACLTGKLPVDGGAGPELTLEQRDMFYGGAQPATIFETWPSIHCLARLAVELALPKAARSSWFSGMLQRETTCLVGANRTERTEDGSWLYGVEYPCQVVVYGVPDLVGTEAVERCICGRVNRTVHLLQTG